MAISGIAALIFMAMPYAIVPIRRSMGLPTHQWDTDPATSHVRFFVCFSPFFSSQLSKAPPPAIPFTTSPLTHFPPQMHMWSADRDLPHTFDDPKLLAAWSQKRPYRYVTPLEPQARDFPEARARLAAGGAAARE